jgi:hypothetical protein
LLLTGDRFPIDDLEDGSLTISLHSYA